MYVVKALGALLQLLPGKVMAIASALTILGFFGFSSYLDLLSLVRPAERPASTANAPADAGALPTPSPAPSGRKGAVVDIVLQPPPAPGAVVEPRTTPAPTEPETAETEAGPSPSQSEGSASTSGRGSPIIRGVDEKGDVTIRVTP
jgi:hypothetical protein